MSGVGMVNVKLSGATRRFIAPKCGITNVIVKDQIIEVTAAQSAYLTSLMNKDRSNNIQPLFVITEEDATASADARMTEQQRLAKTVMAEAKGEIVAEEVEEVKEVAKPAPKRRAKKTSGTRGTRNASKVVA